MVACHIGLHFVNTCLSCKLLNQQQCICGCNNACPEYRLQSCVHGTELYHACTCPNTGCGYMGGHILAVRLPRAKCRIIRIGRHHMQG